MARLLATKLQPPPLRPRRVYRPHLYEHLADFESGVVLVSAPPGFGKSTFVVEWLHAQHRPFAWYSVDAYDSDVGLFGEYLGEAVEAITGCETGLVSVPGEQAPDVRTMIATLVGDLQEAPSGAALVLDDYHEIESQDVHDLVGYLVENLPQGLVLVIVTRADPPLPLSRLRLQGRLCEIRGAHLRFTVDEIEAFLLETADAHLDADQLRTVAERSEGWVSALQLVSLAIDPGDPADIAASLSALHPHIDTYLADEVLDRLGPELGRFLLRTSPFNRFDARLCREVAGFPEAAELIAEAERRNAFLIPLGQDGEWYRYHHLFADLLRSKLLRSDPAAHRTLLTDAATSCEQRGMYDDAIEYALRSGDVALAGAIVETNMWSVLGAGEVSRLRSWLRRFPVPAPSVEHILALGWAWCRIFEGNLAAATELVDRIEAEHLTAFDGDPSGQLETMRAVVAFQAGRPTVAERHALEAVARLGQAPPYLESLAYLYVGRSLHAQGRRTEARPNLERAASLAERCNTLAAVTALFWLGVVDMDLGNLSDAERSMMRAQEVGSVGRVGEPHPAAGIGDIGLAYIHLNRLEPEPAAELAERGTRLLERSTFVEMVFRGFFVWAEARSVAGHHEDASEVAELGIQWLEGRSIGGGPLETWMLMARARNAWRSGRLDDAEALLDRVRRHGLGSPNEDEALGFYESADAVSQALRCGRVAEARRLFDALPHDPTENVMFAIKRNVLEAALHELEGDARAAVHSIEEAIELAVDGYRFQFSFVGPAIQPVLERMVGRTRHDDFVRSIIERLPDEADSPVAKAAASLLVDPLTKRELDVLAEIAAGYTNAEIAERLFISRGTVKRHASNLYLKLGAHHRTEAAARGRKLGLIP